MNMLRLPSEVQFVAKGVIVILAVSAGDVYSNLSEAMSRKKKQALTKRAGGI
jgi:ribose/xylose/arabinose/galactoside ABC-type transport system permease subunit